MSTDYFIHLKADEAVDLIARRVVNLLTIKQEAAPPPIHPPASIDEILQKKDVSKLLCVSLTTITNWMREGILPFYRKGKRVFFKKAEVLASLEKPKFSNITKR